MKTFFRALLIGLAWIATVAYAYDVAWHRGRTDGLLWAAKQYGRGYDVIPRAVFPVEAYGANWKIQRFRKNVRFPDNFKTALPRAMNAAKQYEGTELRPYVTVGPGDYRADIVDLTNFSGTVSMTHGGALTVGVVDVGRSK